MKVLILADYYKKKAIEFSVELVKWFSERGVSAMVLQPGEEIRSSQKFDSAVLLGGDGFYMKRGPKLAKLGIPVLVINFGTIGFCAVAEKENWPEILEKVLQRRFKMEEKFLLDIFLEREKGSKKFQALNDVYIKHAWKLAQLRVIVDGEIVHQKLEGDGIIVASPSGSTAYNWAAGGSISQSGLMLTPICPYPPVGNIPRVLGENQTIEIVYLGVKSAGDRSERGFLIIDGQRYFIKPGERVRIKKSDTKVKLIIPEGFSFFEALQEKLGLSK